MDLSWSGMPWRTFWGYINGYSEGTQIAVPAKKKISRHLKLVGKGNQKNKGRFTVSRFVLLVGAKRYIVHIGKLLKCKPSCDSGRTQTVVKHFEKPPLRS